jgi:regulator of sirC expression with transglutaminase-like and TPR domain
METPKNLQQLSLLNVEAVPLEEIALLVAKDYYPELDTVPYLKRLDELAQRAQYHIEGVVGNTAIARTLSYYLFDEEGFRGNTSDYYNPSNNFFNDVLDQRTGMPITLCILYVAVGRRLGLPVSGVSFPGHFLVHFQNKPESFYVDAFHHGKLLSENDCKKRLRERYANAIPDKPKFFQPSSHLEILIRLLSNLKMSFMLKKEYETVLNVLNNILLFTPDGTEELKERGLIYFHLECFQAALEDLESYLSKVPSAPDRIEIEACITDLREKVEQIS